MVSNKPPISAFSTNPIADSLLMAVAIKVQLPPSQYRLMTERYGTILEHLQRSSSPLADKVMKFYPQGSVAIQATIARWVKTDEYDVDAIAELDFPKETPPNVILDTLYHAIKGEKGSMYYDMTVRRTRCVTVNYADGMHVDITPAVLLDEVDPRRSLIFHAHENEPKGQHYTVIANPFGFIDWFNGRGRSAYEKAFAEKYAKDSYAFDGIDPDPVPGQEHVYEKDQNVVALQLIKRHRNIKYDKRKVKRPPSVLYSLYAGNLIPTESLAGTLLQLARNMIADVEHAEARGQLLNKENPRCPSDRFTDRWPINRAEQTLFLSDMKEFEQKIIGLMVPGKSIAEMRTSISELFGDTVAMDAVNSLGRLAGQATQTGARTISSTGRVASVAAGSSIITPQAPTFFGDKWENVQ